jgi:hypothetical protein
MNGNGKLFNGRFSKADDMILKVGAGVATALIVAVAFFGMRVYAFMQEGERFTPEMHRSEEAEQMQYIEKHYVRSDVYDSDMKHLEEQLDRIERKLDKVLNGR